MFNTFGVRNYKGFEFSKFPVAPLTIFVGRNSSGKSSIFQLLLCLRQSMDEKKTHPLQLIHNGKYAKIGASVNAWRNRDRKNSFSCFFDFSSPELKSILNSEAKNSLMQYLHYALAVSASSFSLIQNNVRELDLRKIISNFMKDMDTYLSGRTSAISSDKKMIEIAEKMEECRKILKLLNKASVKKESSLRNVSVRLESVLRNFSSTNEIKVLLDIFDNVNKDKLSDEFSLHYEFDISDNRAIFAKRISLKTSTGKNLFSIDVGSEASIRNIFRSINSDYTDTNIGSYSSGLSKHVNRFNISLIDVFYPSQYSFESEDYINVPSLVANVLHVALEKLFGNNLRSSFFHVPPLRAHPRRYYYEDVVGGSLDDQSIFERLEQKDVKSEIDGWFAEFGVKLGVEDIEEVLRKIMVSPNSSKDLKLEIADVGFGFSQILPVLASVLASGSKSMTLIEQPEVHLHPDMQAAFGNLLARLIKPDSDGNRRHFIVETHSEYLVTEVRALMAKGMLESDDVSLVYFEQDEVGNNISGSAGLDKSGTLTWPYKFVSRHLENQRALIAAQAGVRK